MQRWCHAGGLRDTPQTSSRPRGRLSAPSLRCTDLAVWLDNTAVLRGVDLYVPSGSVTALLGASGAGKSTLIKHLLGLLPPDEGTVAIGDQDIWSSTPAQLLELRRNLSALHSGPTVYDGSVFASLSVRDNLLAVLHEKHANPSRAAGGTGRGGGVTNPYLKLWTEGVPQSDAIPELAERVQWWLDRLDLAEVADQQPHQVSAGLRRRAALGGALAVDVPLYVLDDIDGAIDATHRQIVLDAVLDTHRRTGATMLIATHDVQLARAVADRIAVLAGGRIVFHGSPEEALTDLHRWYRTDDGLVEPEAHPGTIPAARRPSEPLGPHSDAPQRSRTPAAPPSATERVTPRPPRRLLVPTLITATVFAAIVLLFVLAIPRL